MNSNAISVRCPIFVWLACNFLPQKSVKFVTIGLELLFICQQISSPKICQIFNHWMQDLSFNHAWRIDTKRFLLLDPFLSISIQWFYRNFQHKPSSGEFSNFSDPFDLGWNHELFLVSNFVCTLFFPFFTSSNKNSGKTLAILLKKTFRLLHKFSSLYTLSRNGCFSKSNVFMV